jgi:hypothetical protein
LRSWLKRIGPGESSLIAKPTKGKTMRRISMPTEPPTMSRALLYSLPWALKL